MNIKLSGIAAAGLLAMLALAPMGLAHDDSPQGSSTRVSGVAVGAADPRLQLVAFGPPIDGEISLGSGLCDMEVASGENDGTNERYIDGFDVSTLAGVGPLAGTFVAEGTWDDGGIGAVCHTTNMQGTNFDTWGCNSGGAGDNVAAVDRVAMTPVWVIAGCNWGYATGGSSFNPTPLPGVSYFQSCVTNDVVLGNLGTPEDIPADAGTCATNLATYATNYVTGGGVNTLVTCLTTPALCPQATGGTFSCQGGMGTNEIGQGYEDTDSGLGNSADVDFPTPFAIGSVTCNDNQGLASLFVYNSVIVNAGVVGSGAAPATIVDVA